MGTDAFFASDEEENDWAEGGRLRGRLRGLLTRLEELEGEASGEEEVGERGLAFRSLWCRLSSFSSSFSWKHLWTACCLSSLG